jgi:hypothetical protein
MRVCKQVSWLVVKDLHVAIEKTGSTNNNCALDLWENMKTLPGFGLDFLGHYYAYMVENPRIATAFQVLDNDLLGM